MPFGGSLFLVGHPSLGDHLLSLPHSHSTWVGGGAGGPPLANALPLIAFSCTALLRLKICCFLLGIFGWPRLVTASVGNLGPGSSDWALQVCADPLFSQLAAYWSFFSVGALFYVDWPGDSHSDRGVRGNRPLYQGGYLGSVSS